MNITSTTVSLFATNGSAATGGAGGLRGIHRHHSGDQMKTIADTLGIGTDQLAQELGSGSTLAQVAQNHGKTGDDLVKALQAKDKSRLDQAVADGKVTQDQETQFLQKLKERETGLVNGAPPARGGRGPGGAGKAGDGDGDDTGSTGGTDVASLLGPAGFQGGSASATTPMGQALKAYGVDAGSLEKALLDAVKTKLDGAVGAGKLAQSQEDSLLQQLASSLDQAFGTNAASGVNSGSGTAAVNHDLASLVDGSGPVSSGSASSSYAASFQASIRIDVAA